MNKAFLIKGLPVIRLDANGPAAYGFRELEAALERLSVKRAPMNHWTENKSASPVLIVGTTKNRRVQKLLDSEGVGYLLPEESLFVRWCEIPGGTALLLAGTDETGLMYNLLEMARRLDAHGLDALSKADNLTETPQNRVRCVDRYLLGHLDDEWFKSEEFWRYLVERMARNRFNRFCLILGFDTAYMSPPYPFFLRSGKYPEVTVNNLTDEGMAANLAALRRIGALCHEYGMKLVLATWQQRPWTTAQDQLVANLPEEVTALGEYCYNGVYDLVKAVPEIDVVQFRVNHESGVGDQVSAEDFWNRCVDAVADVAKDTGRPLIMDLRAKGLTDTMIAHAFERGLPVEVPTKYWCEHAALPHHITVMRTEELERIENFNHSRRYSYADMLKKPQYYDLIFRLWNYGSTNLFLWGDADYARRFSISCGLSGSVGFQINTPLSLKYGHELSHKEAWHTFKNPALRSGRWEDERFWMWYIVFGRLGYNPDTDSAVWLDEFAARFGKAGSLLAEALAAASKIVPLVTTIHMPVHPSLRYWTELSTGWALFVENNLDKRKYYDPEGKLSYGSTEPSDHGLFYGIDEFAEDLTAARLLGKYAPPQTAVWLERLAGEAAAKIAAAKELGASPTPELLAMELDIAMLCDFARYHAEKSRAALALALWHKTGELSRLSDALLLLDKAIAAWKSLAEQGLENYHDDLNFSSAGSETRRGTWADLTKELEADRGTLVRLMEANGAPSSDALAGCYLPKAATLESGRYDIRLPEEAVAGQPLEIGLLSSGLNLPQSAPVLHYRHLDQTEGLFRTMEMLPAEGGYAAEIPAEYVTAAWDLQVYITVQDPSGSCVMLPGVYHPVYPYPYHVISVRK